MGRALITQGRVCHVGGLRSGGAWTWSVAEWDAREKGGRGRSAGAVSPLMTCRGRVARRTDSRPNVSKTTRCLQGVARKSAL
ncbi:hypothetical protein D3C87_736840 [compost metagenome]